MDGNPVSEFVKTQRLARGWTQEQLAEVAKVGVRTVQRLERDGIAGLSTLQSLASALGVPIERLRQPVPAPSGPPGSNRRVKVETLPRITTGNDAAAIVANAEMFQHDHDPLTTEAEVEVVAGFLQLLQDYGDIWGDLDTGDRVKATFGLNDEIAALERAGFHAFGALLRRKVKFPNAPEPNVLPMAVSLVVVLRASNSRIVRSGGKEALPVVY